MIKTKSFISYRDLFWQLTLREIKAKYKQSVLGYSWVILVPLINLAVLSIIFTFLFRVPTGNVPYPIFLFVALVPWLFMANAITGATGSIIANSSLVTKVSLPREILPSSVVASKLVDLTLTSLILLLFLFIYQINFHLSILFLPVILIIQLILTLGISFILSATNVFFRDVEHTVGVMLTVWMYLTPVIYSPDLIPQNLKFFFSLNPMAGIIVGYRNTILYGTLPETGSLLYAAAFSITLFTIGYLYFRNRARYFADVI